MTQVLVTRTGSVSSSDRAKLHEAGIVVVETFEPDSIRLLDLTGVGVSGGSLLYCAMRALDSGGTAFSAQATFAQLVLAELQKQRDIARGKLVEAQPRGPSGKFVSKDGPQSERTGA